MGICTCLSNKQNLEEKYTFENGDSYIGIMKNKMPNGRGKRFYGNTQNVKYIGNYVNGLEEGEGQYIWENGEYYIGNWEKGKKQGKGAIYSSNGYIKSQGNFKDDCLINYGNDIYVPNNISDPIQANTQNNNNNHNTDDYIYVDIK